MAPSNVTFASGDDSERRTSLEKQHFSTDDIPATVKDENYSTYDLAGLDFDFTQGGCQVSMTDSILEKYTNSSDVKGWQSTELEKSLLTTTETDVEMTEKVKTIVRMQNTSESTSDDSSNGKTTAVLKPSPSVGTNLANFEPIVSPGNGSSRPNCYQVNAETGLSMMDEAWEGLKKSYVYFKGKPVGTLAAIDPSAEALNYNQVS